MKNYVLGLFLLIASQFAFADINTPTAGAVCGQVYGQEVCVWAVYGAGGVTDEYGLRAVYKSGDEWAFLAEATHFISNFTSKDSTDYYFGTFVAAINTQIEIQLKPFSGAEPESGIERIQWLVTQLSFSNNQLVYSP